MQAAGRHGFPMKLITSSPSRVQTHSTTTNTNRAIILQLLSENDPASISVEPKQLETIWERLETLRLHYNRTVSIATIKALGEVVQKRTIRTTLQFPFRQSWPCLGKAVIVIQRPSRDARWYINQGLMIRLHHYYAYAINNYCIEPETRYH